MSFLPASLAASLPAILPASLAASLPAILPASLAVSLPATTSFPPASARAGRFWPSLWCIMPGQALVVAAVTDAAAAAVLLVSPAAAVAAYVVTCWRMPACQWQLLPHLAVLMVILAATS